MKLKTITFTGIDDRTEIEDLQKLQYFFPNAEFGVLISKNWDKNGDFSAHAAAAAQCFAWFVWIKGWKGDTTVKWI